MDSNFWSSWILLLFTIDQNSIPQNDVGTVGAFVILNQYKKLKNEIRQIIYQHLPLLILE